MDEKFSELFNATMSLLDQVGNATKRLDMIIDRGEQVQSLTLRVAKLEKDLAAALEDKSPYEKWLAKKKSDLWGSYEEYMNDPNRHKDDWEQG